MSDIGKLISGFRVFKATTFAQQQDTIIHLLELGHKPTTMIIACADLRVPPATIFSANVGELFVVNNIGGLVPNFNAGGIHGIMSAIEYGVTGMEVENIIVLGHAKCPSIEMIMSDKVNYTDAALSESMQKWLSIASEARDAVRTELGDKPMEEQLAACEHESIVISMRNLLSYPYIAERMEQDKLNIFGWHFDIESGEIMAFDPDNGFFEPLS